MRTMPLLALPIVFGLLSASPAAAQTAAPAPVKPQPAAARPPATPASRPSSSAAAKHPDTRIAFVNTDAFGDEKAGIVSYVNALKGVEQEFQPRQAELAALETRVNATGEEISKLRAAAQTPADVLAGKVTEYERLQNDLKSKMQEAQAAFNKRSEVVLGPIMQDIGKAMNQFAAERNITTMLDVSKLAGAILTLDPAAEVTQAFIADYNGKHPAAATPAPAAGGR